jgi:hypothetical protein
MITNCIIGGILIIVGCFISALAYAVKQDSAHYLKQWHIIEWVGNIIIIISLIGLFYVAFRGH